MDKHSNEDTTGSSSFASTEGASPTSVSPADKFEKWLDAKITKCRSWLEKRYRHRFAEVERESKERAARNEIAVFAHPLIRFGVLACAIVVFIAILRYTAPPVLLMDQLKGRDVIPVPKAELCFGVGCLNDPSQIHTVKLPFFNLKKFRDYQDHDLFYRFRLSVDSAARRRGLDTILFPIFWGDAEIYRDGIVIASGPSFEPIIPISSDYDEITIHVYRPSGQKYGLRSTFPPLIMSRALARSLEHNLNAEPFAPQYATVAQLAGFCLLLIMFMTFPYRPELFTFLMLFLVETMRGYLIYVRTQGDTVISPTLDSITYNLLVITGAVAMLFFIGTFFRRPVASISRWLFRHLTLIITAIALGYFGLNYCFPTVSNESALFIATWATAFFIAIALTKDTTLFLFRPGSKVRFTVGVLAMGVVAYWVYRNIADYFVINTAITTTYNSHLHFFFFMAAVLGIEIGRTEIKIKEAFSLLPKEVVRLIHDKNESWREGFVVVIDVVGWSRKLRSLNEEETPLYMRRVNEYLLSAFDEPGSSVVSGTGDGFYITFEGPPTREKFEKLVRSCQRLAQARPRLDSLGIEFASIRSEQLVARSAIGFGRYYVGFVQTQNLKKEFLAGFLATSLSRVIGNERDPKSVRILWSPKLEFLRGSRPLMVQETKEDKTSYWLPAA